MSKRMDYISWDEYFMGIALLSANRSKDPSTQVGACIVSKNNKIMSDILSQKVIDQIRVTVRTEFKTAIKEILSGLNVKPDFSCDRKDTINLLYIHKLFQYLFLFFQPHHRRL